MNFINAPILFRIFPVLASIIVAIFCHLLFSKYGFNPSDDGMFLSYSRRILEGQIPHLDFISIRPALSALIHLPEVYFLDETLLYTSRFIVLLQISLFCTLWIKIFSKAFEVNPTLIQTSILICSSFMLCLHSFPLMSWATIDAIFLISFGFYLYYCLDKKYTGYFFLACAYLCKQSFLFVPFGVIIFFKDYHKVSYVLISLLPLILYVTLISYLGGIGDFLKQILAGSGYELFLGVNVSHLLTANIWLGLSASCFCCILFGIYCEKYLKSVKGRLLVSILLLITSLVFLKYLLLGQFFNIAQFLFGSLIGLTLYNLIFEGLNKKSAIMLTVLSAGWSVSLSQGYPQTALFSGIFAILFIFYNFRKIKNFKGSLYVGLIGCFVIAFNFYFARHEEIYRERPSNELIYSLEGDLEGSKRILTNKNVFELFKDLKITTSKYQNFPYVILPDLPYYWATSSRLNPLSADWLQNVEVPSASLQKRIIEEIDELSSEGHLLIVQKYSVNNIANELKRYNSSEKYSFTLAHIEDNFKVLEETDHFLIYGLN